MYVIVFQGMDLNPLIEYTCTKRKLFYPNYYLFINRIPNYYLFIKGIPIHRISLTATSVFFHRILYTCTCNRISSLKTTMTT